MIDWVRVVRANAEPGDAAHVLSQGFKAAGADAQHTSVVGKVYLE